MGNKIGTSEFIRLENAIHKTVYIDEHDGVKITDKYVPSEIETPSKNILEDTEKSKERIEKERMNKNHIEYEKDYINKYNEIKTLFDNISDDTFTEEANKGKYSILLGRYETAYYKDTFAQRVDYHHNRNFHQSSTRCSQHIKEVINRLNTENNMDIKIIYEEDYRMENDIASGDAKSCDIYACWKPGWKSPHYNFFKRMNEK